MNKIINIYTIAISNSIILWEAEETRTLDGFYGNWQTPCILQKHDPRRSATHAHKFKAVFCYSSFIVRFCFMIIIIILYRIYIHHYFGLHVRFFFFYDLIIVVYLYSSIILCMPTGCVTTRYGGRGYTV